MGETRRRLTHARMWIVGVATMALGALCGPGSTPSPAAPAPTSVVPSVSLTSTVQEPSGDVHRSPSSIDPRVIRAPSVLVTGAETPLATVIGENFEVGLTLTLRGADYVVTIGASALMAVTPTSLQFDPSGLRDGIYALAVGNPTGRASNEIPVTVRRK